MAELDLKQLGVRGVNSALHGLVDGANEQDWLITNPMGQHAIACGLDAPLNVTIKGHVVTIQGHAGVGVAENMMSGRVRVTGSASDSAGATAHGGLLVIEGDASSRCGISMKGIDIVVGGSVGHMSGFMAQSGHLVVCGDASDALGDSIYEAILFVRGDVSSLGADCIEKEMRPEHLAKLTELLAAAGMEGEPAEFRRYGSARELYNFDIDNADAY